MAEIKVEKKKSIWPWILLIAGLLAALYYFVIREDDAVLVDDMDDTEYVEEVEAAQEATVAAMLSETAITEINEYKTYISNEEKMGIDHVYSNAALERLIDATRAVTNALDVDINADLDQAQAYATSITKDPYEVDHANKIKDAGQIIAAALKKVQNQKFFDLSKSCTQLQNTVMAIDPQVKTLNQKDAVKSFFDQAGNILTNMINQ